MPKEITHISLAKAVFSKLPESSRFHTPIKKYDHLFLYGAIAPDTFYYYLFGPKRSRIQELSRHIHANHPPSIVAVLDFINHFTFKDAPAMAFAAGVCCHLLADTIFHPMVFYFCGINELHPGAETRHRAFETALDVHFWYHQNKKDPQCMDQIFNLFDTPKGQRVPFLAALFKTDLNIEKRYLSMALSYHQQIYRLLRNHRAYKLFKALHQLGLGIHERQMALIYPVSKPVPLSFFNHTMTYKHPVTGADNLQTIEDMIKKTTHETILLLTLIETLQLKDQDDSTWLSHPDLPLIKPGFSADGFKHWYGQDNLMQMVYKGINPNVV